MSAAPNEDFADVDDITFDNLERNDRRLRICPDWRKEDITTTGLYRLSNDAHPAFQANRFIGPRFSLQDTLQARLFASRLLEADCSIEFWWALMSGETMGGDRALEDREARAADIRTFTDLGARIPDQETNDAFISMMQARTPNHELYLSNPPSVGWESKTLTNHQITKTKEDLRELARYIHYEVDEDAGGSRCMTAWLYRTAAPFRGSPSRIVICAKELRMHSDAMAGDLICQAWASVSLGFKLLQLLAHAAVAAARSGAECNWSNRYRFEGDPKIGAEIRMLESCTFGGILRREQEQEPVAKSRYTIDGVEGTPGLWIAFSDFPGVDFMAMTGADPDGYSLSDPDVGADGPYYYREWQVPLSWLLSLLTDTFWDNDVRTRGQAALTPPKEVGYVMHRDGKTKYGPLHREVIRRGIVPAGYIMLPRTYVMAKKSLDHDGRGHVMFGGYNLGRMAFESDDEMYTDKDQGQSSESEDDGPGSSGPGMAISDGHGEGDGEVDGEDDAVDID